MTYTHPFTYELEGDLRHFLPLGMKIREHYLLWRETDNYDHLDDAVPLMARLVGWTWKQIFGKRQIDQDLLDPIVYKIVFKFVDKTLPTQHSLAEWLRVMCRRLVVRAAYKTYIPEDGDKSVREFNYRPFMSPGDVEHLIFVEEMKELILDYIEHDTRFDVVIRQACRYLASVLMQEKMPSPWILKDKFGIPYKEQQFYIDFTTVVLRNELYKFRDSLPHLYGNERRPFVAVLGDCNELEETESEEEDAQVCDF